MYIYMKSLLKQKENEKALYYIYALYQGSKFALNNVKFYYTLRMTSFHYIKTLL